MAKFYVTFGQKYRHETHPKLDYAHPDGVVEIEAPNENTAFEWVVEALDVYWAALYPSEDFDFKYYPRGVIGYISKKENNHEL